MKWVCKVCGYVHEGDQPPEKCPVCKAPASAFVKQDAEKAWAAEHVVGVAKEVPEEIKEGLRANFTGECTEVGMYLAMARAAHREGYPEIGLYWEKAAFEEAEHAPSLPSCWAKWFPLLRKKTFASAWKPKTAPRWARPTWPRRPRNWVWTPSMIPSMKWPAMKPVTARPSRAC